MGVLKDIPRNHLPWLGGSAGCLFLTIIFYAMFMSGADTERMRAMEAGQRLIYDLATGQIEGTMQQMFPDTLPAEPEGPVEETTAPPTAAPTDLYAEFTAGLEEQMNPSEPAEEQPTASTEPEGASLPDLSAAAKEQKTVPVFARSVASLEAANQIFMQNTPVGMLPNRGPNNTVPWKFYARPDNLPEDTPRLAIAITDLGAHHNYGKEALMLPMEVTLMFQPYGPDVPKWLESARNRGHEAWLQLAVEERNFPAADPGPLGLLTGLTQRAALERFHKTMARAQAYSGVYFPHNGVFSRADSLMNVILSDVRARGLLALIGNEDTSNGWQIAYTDTVLPQNFHIAPPYNEEILKRTFESIERKVLEDEAMVVTIEPTPYMFEALKNWLPTLTNKGIGLAPLSALANQ